MVTQPSPSFIPKQPARGNVQRRGTRKVYLLAYLSFVLFFGTIIAAAGTFFYELSLKSQLEAQKSALVEQRNQFNQADIERIRDLDIRLTAAKDLLDQHISVVALLDSLEASTLQTIKLSSLSINHNDMSTIEVEVGAMTDDFNSVLFQREILSSNPVLNGASFNELSGKNLSNSNASADEVSEVTFLINKKFTPSEILYRPQRIDAPVIQSSEEILSDESDLFGEDSDTVNENVNAPTI